MSKSFVVGKEEGEGVGVRCRSFERPRTKKERWIQGHLREWGRPGRGFSGKDLLQRKSPA